MMSLKQRVQRLTVGIATLSRSKQSIAVRLCGGIVLGLMASLLLTSTLGYLANSAAAQTNGSGDRPSSGTVQQIVSGDIMCYVTLVGDNGTVYSDIGADFEICANSDTYLNRRVNLVYGQARVNDCEGAEPCGRSRLVTLITQMQMVNRPSNCAQGASAGYLPPRLQVGMRGHSVHVGNLNMRQQPGLQSRIVGTLAPGGQFTVQQGPSCQNSYVWWKVNTGRTQGWVAEGEPSSMVYWLTPNAVRN